jgi:glycosyltransferase involved in cell wall biosynthesis
VVTDIPRNNLPEAAKKQYRRRLFCREEQDGVRVLRLPAIPTPRAVPLARGAEHILTGIKYALGALFTGRQDVSIVYSPPLPLGLSASLVRLARGAPFIFNVQDIYPQTAIDLGLLRSRWLIRLAEAMERHIYRRARWITVHSPGNREVLIQRGAQPEKVVVVPNWVDTAMIRPGPRDNGFRQGHQLDEGAFVVSFAGTMGFAQGLETLMEAAALVQERPEVLFLLVGDGALRPALEQRVRELKLSNVRFLPMQPREEYPALLQASDVSLVTLSQRVATPVVPAKLLSIMASGRPVIAAVPGGGDAAAIVREAGCGLWVEPESPRQMAEAVLRLQADRALGEAMGQRGRRYAEQHFSQEACVRLYQGLMEQAVGPGAQGRGEETPEGGL